MKSTRSKQTCTVCKRRKVRCDGNLPCGNCARHGQHCDYSTYTSSIVTANGVSKPKKQNKEEYIRYLENRNQELEHKVLKLQSGRQSVTSEQFANLFSSARTQNYRIEVSNRYHTVLPTQLAEIVFKSLPEDERSHLTVPRMQYYGWNMSGEPYLKSKKLPPRLLDIDLQYIEESLLDFYFTHINPLFAIIHESVFRDQWQKYKHELVDQEDSLASSTGLYTAMMYLVLALSIRFSRNHTQFQKNQDFPSFEVEHRLFQWGYDVVQTLSFEWQSCELIQCWILITFYLRVTHRQSSSYASLGSAIRILKGMSLNYRALHEITSPVRPYERLKHQRVFWTVFIWDRLYSIQTGRPYEVETNLETPELSNDAIDDTWLTKPALAMIHLAKIAGNMYGNADVSEITSSFKEWEEWTEKNLQDCEPLLRDQVYLTYHDLNLSLNNIGLLKLVDLPDDLMISPAILHNANSSNILSLIQHSSAVLGIMSNLKSQNLLFVPWWLNLALLFQICMVCIILINSGLHIPVASQKLREGLALLTIYKENGQAKMASECVWVIKMLNHICVDGFKTRMNTLIDIGIDHGSSAVNKNNFGMFGRVCENREKDTSISKRPSSRKTNSGLTPASSQTPNSGSDFAPSLFQPDIINKTPDLLYQEHVDANVLWFDSWLNSVLPD